MVNAMPATPLSWSATVITLNIFKVWHYLWQKYIQWWDTGIKNIQIYQQLIVRGRSVIFKVPVGYLTKYLVSKLMRLGLPNQIRISNSIVDFGLIQITTIILSRRLRFQLKFDLI